MSGMMGQMMGNNNQGANVRSMPHSVLIFLVFLIVLVVGAVGGAAYYSVVPEIEVKAQTASITDETASETVSRQAKPLEEGKPTSKEPSWPVLLRTSKPEERRVLEVLSAHGGKYLQKLIVKESGLSKLKTHRILSAFVERGIVTAQKSGNTNEITLADWLQPKSNS